MCYETNLEKTRKEMGAKFLVFISRREKTEKLYEKGKKEYNQEVNEHKKSVMPTGFQKLMTADETFFEM